MPGLGQRIGVLRGHETGAIVFDREGEVVFLQAHQDGDLPRPGMAHGIAQRLLHQAKGCQLDLGAQAAWLTTHEEFGAQSLGAGILRQGFQSREEAQLLQVDGAQGTDGSAQVVQGLLAKLARLPQAVGGRREVVFVLKKRILLKRKYKFMTNDDLIGLSR